MTLLEVFANMYHAPEHDSDDKRRGLEPYILGTLELNGQPITLGLISYAVGEGGDALLYKGDPADQLTPLSTLHISRGEYHTFPVIAARLAKELDGSLSGRLAIDYLQDFIEETLREQFPRGTSKLTGR